MLKTSKSIRELAATLGAVLGIVFVVLFSSGTSVAASFLGSFAVPSGNHEFGNTFDGGTGSFTDIWEFKINNTAPDANLEAFVTSFGLFGFSTIDDIHAELWDENATTLLASSGAGASLGAMTVIAFSGTNLKASERFQIIVTGTIGATPGTYDGSFALSPVPLPGALLLFGTGLIGLVGLGRRRAKSVSDSATGVPVPV